MSAALPDSIAWRVFFHRLLNAAGIASLGAGVIFFVAANWQDYGIFGRFAIVQAGIVACVGLALWKPPGRRLGESMVALATILTGALLALFGQSYQTGADIYELFFTWALLTLPFAFATRSGATWAIWWVVVNVGLVLYCSLQEMSLMRWIFAGRSMLERPLVIFACGVVNLAGALAFERRDPRWLARLPFTFGFGFATVASIFAVLKTTEQGAFVILAFAAASVLLAILTLRRKQDPYPMALIFASWIAISTTAIIVTMKFHDLGGFFLIALWLIGTSTAAGFFLMGWVREWRKPS